MPLVGDITQAVQAYPALTTLVTIGVIMLGTYVLTRISDRLLDEYFEHAAHRMNVGKTSYVLMRRLSKALIYLIGISIAIYTVPQLRQLSLALLASAGFIGIVVGFAAQSAFSNIIAGIFIVIFQPFRVGHNIITAGQYGEVEDITLRHTVVKTPRNERLIMPNAKILDDSITNYSITEEKSRYDIEIGVAYGSSIDTARTIMIEEADAHDMTDTGESEVIVKNLSDSAVVLELRIWAHDRPKAWRAGQDLRESIKKRFDDEEDITIPFPQRTISYLDDAKGDREEQ